MFLPFPLSETYSLSSLGEKHRPLGLSIWSATLVMMVTTEVILAALSLVVSLSVRDKFAADVQLKYPGNPRKGIFRRLQHGLFDLLLSE